MFSFRLFGGAATEEIVWSFLSVYLVIMFYINFFDHSKHKVVGRRLKPYYTFTFSGLLLLAAAIMIFGRVMTISYFFFWWILLFLALPTIAFVLLWPRYLYRLAVVSLYFFVAIGSDEWMARYLGYWTYPGVHYVGSVSLGGMHLPYEEVLYIGFLFSAAILAYFEFFDNDRVKLGKRLSYPVKIRT
jgi:hypothetical protein